MMKTHFNNRCFLPFFRVMTCGKTIALIFASALVLTLLFSDSALAQEDLKGESITLTPADASLPDHIKWETSYTNSYNTLSTITIHELADGTQYTYSGALTGNIAVDITHQGYSTNGNRVVLSGNNNFSGGLTMRDGILFTSSANVLGTGTLTLSNAVLMPNVALNFTIPLNIPAGKFAGLRASNAKDLTYSGQISGDGDLVIVTEGGAAVILSGTNIYSGVTSIGTVQGGANTQAKLTLGVDNTLPSTTVVEIGKSQNPTYKYTSSTIARLNLNGTTQTISGLYGGGVAEITNSGTTASNLTINLADGASFEYSGKITGNSADKPTNLSISGAGNQTLAGNVTNASITKNGTGALTLSGGTVTLSSLAVTDGSFALGSNTALTVSGKLTLNSPTLDLNGSSLTYTSNVASDFNNVNITNTNTDKQSVLSFVPSSNLTAAQTFSKTVSGNTRIVVKLPQNQENLSQFILTGTNDHTGGLLIDQGTVKVDSYASLGTNKQIDMRHSSLMTSLTFEGYTINLTGDTSLKERGAIRLSGGNGQFAAKVTGVGSFEIVNDGAVTLTNTGNDYQGKTYIGNFQWRSNGLNNVATLNLGASEVLPNTTEVVFGKNADGGGTSGKITLDLKGFNETVSYISGESTNAEITSSTPATLTLIGNNNYTFVGKVTGSATVDKKGTGTLTMTGANTGSLVVSGGTLVLDGDNTGVQSITVKEGGNLVPKTEGSMATTVNLQTTAFAYPDNKFVKNTDFVISENGTVISVPMAGAPSGTYARQLFTGASKDFRSYFTNPEYISNMDKIANTAYVPGTASYFTADIWGSTTGDENNTNLLMTNVVNTTDSSITLQFAYKFHNNAYLAVTDSKGNGTVVLDWGTSSGNNSKTDSFTFEPGETYTIEARLFRFNRTIGANNGGLNGTSGTLVGLGARVSGSNGEYLPLNYNGNNWTFSDGSFITSTSVSYNAKSTTINSDATLEFNTQNNDFIVTSNFSGAGTLIVNPNEGFTHTYSGNIGGSLSLRKTGDGVLVLNHANDMTGTVDVQAGEIVYAQAGAMNLVSGLTIAQDAQLTVDLPKSDGAAGVNGSVQNNGTITITKGRLRTYGITGNGTIVMDGGTLMNLGRSVNGNHAETIVDNAIVIEEGKTGTFNVGWAKNSGYPDSKLQLNGSLSGAGDFILETNSNAPDALSQIAPLIANFASSEFTGNVITNSGYNMLVMGKENAFGESVGMLQDNGWVDINGFNQTFAGLTGTGNLINRGSSVATLTLNVPEGESSKFEGKIYGIESRSNGKSYKDISLFKTGLGTVQFNVDESEVYIHDVIVNSGRIDFKEYFYGSIEVNNTATLSPGNSVGTLTIDGTVLDSNLSALVLHSGSTLLMEVGKDNQGNVITDELIVNGNAVFEDGSILLIAMDPDKPLSIGDSFTMTLTMNNAEAMFDSVSSAVQSYYFTGLDIDRTGNVITITGHIDPNAIPEPSTWALLVLGFAGLMYWRKRK